MFLAFLLFFIISKINKSNFIFIIQLLAIFSYIIQYSHYHNFLTKYKGNIRLPLLNTLGIFPCCVIAIIFAKLQMIEFFHHKKNSLILSFLLIYLIFKYKIFVKLGGFNGIEHIFVASSFFVGIYLLPLENINPGIQLIIKQITSYTNGIYCLQTQISTFIYTIFGLYGDIKTIIVIYSISYLISFIGIKIFGKTKFKYLFI